jgi:arylmalonate decarboxylase
MVNHPQRSPFTTMNQSRRQFLRAGCGLALAPWQGPGRDPVLGVILPTAGAVPAEALAMYPARIRFVTEGLARPGDPPLIGTLATYERLQDRIGPAARSLVDKGADAILLLGTSVTFYRGSAYNQRVIDSIRTATSRPATTMSSGIVDAIRVVNGKRLAVASGYTEEVNAQFRVFLEGSGFDVVALRGLGLLTPPDNLSRHELEGFVVDVCRAAPNADAVVVAFASTRTLELIAPLEKRCTVPVISARPHAFWAGVRLLGLNAAVKAVRLLECLREFRNLRRTIRRRLAAW